jgi:serine/threonine protein kinase
MEGKEAEMQLEAENLKAIKSRYVVEVFDSFVEDGFVYVVMELCEGGTLQNEVETLKKSGKHISEEVLLIIFIFIF